MKPLLAALVVLLVAAAPAVAQDSDAPPGAEKHWLPNEEWVNQLWLPFEEQRLYDALGKTRGEVFRWVRIDASNTLAQLGARGVSILISSGDSGVGDSCKVNGKASFTTSFPAACPWVTTVGGTTGNSPESAWSYGGGGFSEVFGRPDYQNATVNKWLTTDTTHSGVTKYFNASGRAYPDISAQATNFIIVASGSAQAVSGTSCSAPTTAGIFQLLNSARIASGKKGLGFLNPWLYSTASSGFTDIKSGKITGCSGAISGAGFSAVAGWDPATGLGTPNYEALLKFATA